MKSKKTQNSFFLLFLAVLYGIFLGWGLLSSISTTFPYRSLFFDTYWTIIIPGLLIGLSAAIHWGGLKSLVGKGILLLCLGLAGQLFGQVVFSTLYTLYPDGVPYPSLADLGYFGSIPLYCIGTWYIARAAGAELGLKQKSGILKVIIIPILLLIFTFYFFVGSLDLNFAEPITTILNFGYPIGQAVYVTAGILAFSLSSGWLGGTLRKGVLLIVLSLLIQYVADSSFLYLSGQGLWQAGGINDVLYLTAYFVLSLGFLSFHNAFFELKHERKVV